jgi:putative MATE family efflux protein
MLQAALSYADFIMVGGLGKNASATVGLTQEVNFLLKGVLMALSIGIVSNVSFCVGRRDYKMVKQISFHAFFFAVIAGAALTAVTLAISPALPVWLGAEEDIRADVSSYFSIIYAPVILVSFNIVLGAVLKGIGDMKTPMLVNGLMAILNIILNFFLIYGSRDVSVLGFNMEVWGAGLGVRGSALGTAFASVLGGALMIVSVLRNPTVSPLKERFRIDRGIVKRCLRIAAPVFLCRVTVSLGRVVFTALVAGLGTLAFAAHSIAFTAESIFYMAVVGGQVAVTTMAGNIKGEGNLKKLNELTKLSAALIAGVMTVAGIFMIVAARPIISLFTPDPEVTRIGVKLIMIVALNEPIFAVSIILEGIFNGTGDTKSPFIISAATLWIVRVAGTWLAVSVLGFGIYGAWVCMVAENTVRGIALLIRYRRRKRFLIKN